jgi:hypothetical protein
MRARTKATARTPAAPEGTSAPRPAAVPAERLVQAAPPYGALRKQLNTIIGTYPQYQLGVALIDMSDGVIHTYGVQGKFVAASTAKILAAAAYYHYAERGLVSLTAPMGGHTAAYQIHQMIQQSNNQSWALILRAIGNQRIHHYAAALGISYYRTLNELSPAETATLLYLLYTGRLSTRHHRVPQVRAAERVPARRQHPGPERPGLRLRGVHPGQKHGGHSGPNQGHPRTHPRSCGEAVLTPPDHGPAGLRQDHALTLHVPGGLALGRLVPIAGRRALYGARRRAAQVRWATNSRDGLGFHRDDDIQPDCFREAT